MRPRIRQRLTYANVMATLAFVVAVVGTGSAVAAIVVSSNSQVARGTISGHKPPSGEHPNIIHGSINGFDIADNSGVDTCTQPLVARYGRICVGADGVSRSFFDAVHYCANYGLRLASLSEAIALAKNHDVPGVADVGGGNPSASYSFWTDDRFRDGNRDSAAIVDENGGMSFSDATNSFRTVCVTEPSA